MNERNLWIFVLIQAFRDYLNYNPLKTNVKKYQQHLSLKMWFDINNNDFKNVCWLAGYNPTYVFQKFLILKKISKKINLRKYDKV